MNHMSKHGDTSGRKSVIKLVKYNLTQFSMANAIENGCFSPAKGRFYYSSIDPDDYKLSEVTRLFVNRHDANMRLAKNYIAFLKTMIWPPRTPIT